jgi:hypothetical protein
MHARNSEACVSVTNRLRLTANGLSLPRPPTDARKKRGVYAGVRLNAMLGLADSQSKCNTF